MRYVGDDKMTREEWISYVEIEGTDSESLFLHIVDELKRIELPMDLCIATAFDGAANMSGHISGKKLYILKCNSSINYL